MVVIITIVLIFVLPAAGLAARRAWQAIREDELAAAATASTPSPPSCSPSRSARRPPGFAGVFNASKLVFVTPDQFDFIVSFTVLAMVVLGGMGNIWGVALGAFVDLHDPATGLKQLVRSSRDSTSLFLALGPLKFDFSTFNFINYQFLLYGLALVLMMLFRPEGLFPEPAAALSCTRTVAEAPSWPRRGLGSRDGPDDAGATADVPAAGAPILRRARVTKRFGGLVAVRRRRLRHPRRLDRQPDRAEWRRQDDVLQHHRRASTTRPAARSTFRRRTDREARRAPGSSRSSGSVLPRHRR